MGSDKKKKKEKMLSTCTYQNNFPIFYTLSSVCIFSIKLLDQTWNSLYCQTYNSYDGSSQNVVLDQLIVPKLIFFFILNTYLVDIVLIV